jgi:hypothetical protein
MAGSPGSVEFPAVFAEVVGGFPSVGERVATPWVKRLGCGRGRDRGKSGHLRRRPGGHEEGGRLGCRRAEAATELNQRRDARHPHAGRVFQQLD